ncbi:MAG: TerC family protein [Synechococcaceae cyanobacterium]|jgi:YkoY family integral membrane protein
MEAESVSSLSPLLQSADQWHEVLLLLPLLVALEAVLSADNAIALAAISRRLHNPERQRLALNVGLLLALVFRLLLILAARWVLHLWPLQLLASGYLLWLCLRHLGGADEPTAGDAARDGAGDGAADASSATTAPGASTAASSPLRSGSATNPAMQPLTGVILTLAFTDLAFSLDSVAAAVAVTDRLPLVMAGGVIGVIALRLTAELFIRWLEIFRHLETAGYLAVGLVGLRLLLRVLLPNLLLPDWSLLLLVAALFAWGFSSRQPVLAEPLPEGGPRP